MCNMNKSCNEDENKAKGNGFVVFLTFVVSRGRRVSPIIVHLTNKLASMQC